MTKPPAEPRSDREAEWYRRQGPGDLSGCQSGSPTPGAERDSLRLPDEFRLFDHEGGIELRFPVAGPLLRGPLLWGQAVAWTTVGFFALLGAVGGLASLVILFAIGIAIALPFGIVGMFRRVVAVRPEGVEVSWWPLPFQSRRLVAREIRQVFVVERGPGLIAGTDGRFRKGVDFLPGSPDTASAREFDLWILRPDGSRECLVRCLRYAEHALFLERWLERRLGIEDERVAGERG